jgi:hypothetical protein
MAAAIVQSAGHNAPVATLETTATVTLAAPATAGNTLLAVCFWDKNAGVIAIPAGFTAIGTSHDNGPSVNLALAYKVAVGGETSFTSTSTSGASNSGLVVLEISGLTSTPFDLGTVTYVDDTNVTTRTTAALGPTTTADSFALAIYAIDTIQMINNGSSPAWTNGFATIWTTASGSNAGQAGGVIASHSYSSIQASIQTAFSYSGTADQAMTGLVVFKVTPSAPPPPTPKAVQWGLAHPASISSVKVSFELDATATDAEVEVVDYNTLAVVATSGIIATDSEKIAQATITGLDPNTRYKWRVKTTANGLDTAFTGSFYTNWNRGTVKTYNVALIADQQVNNNDYTAYPRVLAFAPVAMLSDGDHPYIDESANTPATFRSKYRTLLTNASWRSLANVTPYAYIYDDHDWGGNDSFGSSASAPAVATEFRRFFPVPTYAGSATQAHSFVLGRVRHIMMDLRAERIAGVQIMSATQLQWVKDEITAAKAAVQAFVLHSSSPCHVPASQAAAQPDTWAPYAAQRTAIYDHIQSIGMQLAGFWRHDDAHMLAYEDGTNSHYSTDGSFGMVMICTAAVSSGASVKGGTYSGGTLGGTHQFGMLTITEDTTNTVSVRIRLIKGDDSYFADQTIALVIPEPVMSTTTHNLTSKYYTDINTVLDNTALVASENTVQVNIGVSERTIRFRSDVAWIYLSTSGGNPYAVAAGEFLELTFKENRTFYVKRAVGDGTLYALVKG